MSFNLPPGCSVNDIPGNRPEDDDRSPGDKAALLHHCGCPCHKPDREPQPLSSSLFFFDKQRKILTVTKALRRGLECARNLRCPVARRDANYIAEVLVRVELSLKKGGDGNV